MQRRPEALAGDAAVDVDPAHRLGIREVAQHVLAPRPDHGQAAGDVLDQGFEGGQQNRQALALLGPADKEHLQLAVARLRTRRRGLDVDPVGDDLVAPAEPAAPGPGGRLGDRDPRREAVEDPAGPERRGEVVWQRLGRVGVKGADDRRARAQHRVPADQRHHRLVDVNHVVATASQLLANAGNAAGGRRREIGDGSVGGDPDRATERDQVIGQLARLRRRSVQRPAEPVGRIDGGEHADVVATSEELLGERLDVPVHAALVAPGIWRDKGYSHEALSLEDASASAQTKAMKASR